MIKKRNIPTFIISLAIILLLLLFCVLTLLNKKNFKDEGSIVIAFPDQNFYENNYGCSLEKILSFRDFITYDLSDEESKNKKKLVEIQRSIKNIVSNDNSKTGVHVKINIKTKYEDVVKVLDICQVEKATTYIINEYDIWIMTGSNSELAKECPLKFPK